MNLADSDAGGRGRLQGEPVGFWPGGKSCDLAKHLDPHNLVINLTLCGSWAGSTFNADGCPGNCESACSCPFVGDRALLETDINIVTVLRELAYVDQNPAKFKDAFFDIAGVKIYA